MIKERRLLAECADILNATRPVAKVKELVKPYPESALHECTADELKQKLYEARSFQHTLKKFSAEEIKHFEFIDEAVAIIEYKRLDELNKHTLRNYTIKAAGDMHSQGLEQGFQNTVQYMDKPENAQDHRDKALDAQKKNKKRFDGILKATRKMVESEQLDELTTKALSYYRDSASQAVGSYKFGSKAPTMDIKTVNKRVNGFVRAGEKIKEKNAVTKIGRNESVELDESTQHPIAGHEYHSKTNDQLHFIIHDAGKAAKAMKDHNPQAEAKYLDQQNDAATVLGFRKRAAHPKTGNLPNWYLNKYFPRAGKNESVEIDVMEGVMKTIRRHFQGWSDTAEKPNDIKKRVSSMSDASLANSRNTRTKMEPEEHTPEATQRKLIDREFKKRTTVKEGFDRSGALNRIKNLLG